MAQKGQLLQHLTIILRQVGIDATSMKSLIHLLTESTQLGLFQHTLGSPAFARYGPSVTATLPCSLAQLIETALGQTTQLSDVIDDHVRLVEINQILLFKLGYPTLQVEQPRLVARGQGSATHAKPFQVPAQCCPLAIIEVNADIAVRQLFIQRLKLLVAKP